MTSDFGSHLPISSVGFRFRKSETGTRRLEMCGFSEKMFGNAGLK